MDKFQALSDLGAGEFEHLDGTLLEHLRGTMQLLKDWGAPTKLQDAGLYHAAYGTTGFEKTLVSTGMRNEIAKIIGSEAEEIVYQYCACDREHFFPKIGSSEKPAFKNSFTGESYSLSQEMLKMFCELTTANEIEIAIDNPPFISEHGERLSHLFSRMPPYLNEVAQAKIEAVLGAINA